MANYTMPSTDELRERYGNLTNSPALTAVANWVIPNDETEFKEEDALSDLETLDAHFKGIAKEVFEG